MNNINLKKNEKEEDSRIISFRNACLQNSRTIHCSDGLLEIEISENGGGFRLPCAAFHGTQTLAVEIETFVSFSTPFFINFYKKGMSIAEAPVFWARTGVRPRLKSTWTFEFSLMDRTSWPKRTPGRQKLDLAGPPCRIEDMDCLELAFTPVPEPVRIRFANLRVCTGQPQYHIAHKPLLDEMGQYIHGSRSHRQASIEQMIESIKFQYATAQDSRFYHDHTAFFPESWNRWGGWKSRKLCQGTGFFKTYHDGKRWWLADPDGYAFFSAGPDCVGQDRETRADTWDHLLKYIPSADGKYSRFVRREIWGDGQHPLFIDYPGINLMRALGKDWKKRWTEMTACRLRAWGFNTAGNWSDEAFCREAGLPYVLPLNVKAPFPSTSHCIYQDFPDVFSDEYRENALLLARELAPYREDSFLIGYFMCNEPGWGFEKGLNLGLELLKNPQRLVSRHQLADFLASRYEGAVDALNLRWGTSFSSFDAFLSPRREEAERISQAGLEDLRAFTAVLIREYVAVPARECRRVDSRHLNLGMRWAFIHDPLLLSGWECFDVFSINCYKIDPRPSLQAILAAGVDKPYMIGEFHHGALDRGHTATGIRGVASQEDRGRAYRYYVENAASFPNLVGCHYFTYNDQSALGRVDGECYNIGFVDACQVPYPAMIKASQDTSLTLYQVADGNLPPTSDAPAEIPAIYF